MNRPFMCAIGGFALLVAVGDPGAAGADLGRDVAATCANCHGTDGRSRGGVPSLAGKDKGELIRQVRDFRDGKRPSTVMQQLAKGYADTEIEAAAAYFAAQPSR
jgi:sulfide dehydrogenase cytochrome subunit